MKSVRCGGGEKKEDDEIEQQKGKASENVNVSDRPIDLPTDQPTKI